MQMRVSIPVLSKLCSRRRRWIEFCALLVGGVKPYMTQFANANCQCSAGHVMGTEHNLYLHFMSVVVIPKVVHWSWRKIFHAILSANFVKELLYLLVFILIYAQRTHFRCSYNLHSILFPFGLCQCPDKYYKKIDNFNFNWRANI